MKAVHIMADGSIRDSVAGVVVTNEQFYRVLNGIISKQQNQQPTKPERGKKKC